MGDERSARELDVIDLVRGIERQSPAWPQVAADRQGVLGAVVKTADTQRHVAARLAAVEGAEVEGDGAPVVLARRHADSGPDGERPDDAFVTADRDDLDAVAGVERGAERQARFTAPQHAGLIVIPHAVHREVELAHAPSPGARLEGAAYAR